MSARKKIGRLRFSRPTQLAGVVTRLLLWGLACCLPFRVAVAQASFWGHYGALIEQKWLPNHSIKDVLQDARGAIWVATNAGLYTYNITNTAHYDITRYTKNKYLNNELSSIACLGSGEMLIGTQSGLGRFRIDSNTVTLVGAKDKLVTQVIQTNDGLFYVVANQRVHRLDPHPEQDRYVSTRVFDAGVHRKRMVKGAIALSDGSYLIGAADGLWRVKDDQLWPTAIKEGVNILYQQDSTIWVGTASRGIYQCTWGREGLSVAGNYVPRTDLGTSESIQDIKGFDDQGIVFATTERLFYVDRNNFPNRSSIQVKTIFEQNAIDRIFVDKTKTIWIGSRNGLFNLSPLNLLTRFTSFDNSPYQHMAVNDILALTKDSLLIASYTSGLSMLHTDSREITPVASPFKEVKLIRKGKNGQLLIVADGRFFKTAANNLQQVVDTGRKIPMHGVNDVVEMAPGEYWFSHWQRKIIRMRDGRADQQLDRIYQKIMRSFSSDAHVYVLALDSRKNLWVGTRGEGLLRINLLTQSIRKFTRSDHFPDQILCIHEDSRNRLWVGTRDKGLLLYQPDTDDFQLFDHQDGLPSNTICAIQESGDGKLWFSTLNGIARLSEGRIKLFRSYNKESGIFNAEFSFNVTAKGNDGSVYFSTRNGIYAFAALPGTHQEVPLAWTHIDVVTPKGPRGPRTATSDFSSDMLRKIQEEGTIVLKSPQNSLQIGFAKLDYGVPEQHIYMYRLLGYDTTWTVSQGKNSIARYVDLPPKDYVFQVMTTNSDDSWQQSPQSFALTIKPAFWQTDVAHVLYAIVLGGLVFASYKIILRWKAMNRRLKAEMESVKLYDQKMVHYTDLSHEIKNRLTLMLGPLEDALKNKKVNFQMLTRIYDQGQRLERLSDQIMSIRKSESGDFLLTVEEEDISAMVSKIVEDARPLAMVKDIDILFETVYENISGWCDVEIVEIIVTNILNNALKYCRPGDTVKVTLDEQYIDTVSQTGPVLVAGNYLVCLISDTGIGISETDILKITQPFYRARERQAPKDITGKGIGLDLVARLIKKHHGHLEIKSRVNEFTTVVFYLPIARNAFTLQELRLDVKSQPIVISDTNFRQADSLIFPEKPYQRPSIAAPQGNRFELLIVDDDPDLLTYVEELFAADFTVHTASSGAEALRLINEQEVDLIICDLDMPEMNGLTLCGLVKRKPGCEKIPFVLLTGKGSEAQKLVAFEHGVDDFVEKPFRSELLTWRVKSLLKNTGKQVELRTVIVPEPQAMVRETVTERFIQEVVDLIEQHVDKDYLNVDFLADELCMSRATFYRKMEEMFNEPPSSFIKKYRLKKAVMYIQSGNYSLKQISDKCGFSNPRYFSKCFRSEFGVLPSAYYDMESSRD